MATHWRRIRERARRRGQELFAGPLCRLDGHQWSGERLRLSLSLTDYRQLQGTSGSVWPGGLPMAARADGLGVNATLVTANGKLVLVRRSRSVFDSPGMLDTGGGHIDPTLHLRVRGRPDPFVAIEAEVCDEFGLEPEELRDTRLLGLARHRPGGKPELLFLIELDLPFASLPPRLAGAAEGSETEALEAHSWESAAMLLAQRGHELSASGQASLYFAIKSREHTGTQDRAPSAR